MAPLLRRALTCFYCGSRSSQKQHGRIRQWQCQSCEAVNYLDESGNITDPPAIAAAAPTVQYCQSLTRSNSPLLSPSDETLFCRLCIRNQQILTQKLADYFPDSDDPSYPQYEAAYPRFRKELEERYPQVCADCAPRVTARIKATGYAAKTDYLRQMMENSKRSRELHTSRRWDWTYLLVTLGGVMWWSSVLIQMLWNLTGAVPRLHVQQTTNTRGMCGYFSTCTQQIFQVQAVEERCVYFASAFAPYGLIAGLLSIWWNNQWVRKLQRSPGRMKGLGEYYKLQIVLFSTRLFFWWFVRENSVPGLGQTATRASHIMMLIFTVLMTFISCKTVQFQLPQITFQDRTEQLIAPVLSGNRYNPTDNFSADNQPRSSKFSAQSPSFIQPFPVNALAPTPSVPQASSYSPPTPPPEESVGDEMDWSPSYNAFNPTPAVRIRQPIQIRPIPSPFHGHLPPAPISPAHRLRNPPNQPIFRKTSEKQQQNFFESVVTGGSVGFDQNTHDQIGGDKQKDKAGAEMAPPRFFPPSDNATSGLERLFEATFSLQDEPKEVLSEGESTTKTKASNVNLKRSAYQSLCSIIPLLGALVCWYGARGSQLASVLRSTSMTISGSLAFWNLVDVLRYQHRGSIFSIIISSFELLASFLLVNTVAIDGQIHTLVDLSGVALLGAMLLQEGLACLLSQFYEGPTKAHPQTSSPKGHSTPNVMCAGNDSLSVSDPRVQTRGVTDNTYTRRESIPSTGLADLSLGSTSRSGSRNWTSF